MFLIHNENTIAGRHELDGLAIKTGTSWLAGKFRVSVVEKWSRRRAEAFFQTFVLRLASIENDGRSLKELEPQLAEILDDEVRSEVRWTRKTGQIVKRESRLGAVG